MLLTVSMKAQTNVLVDVEKNSWIAIRGTSNVVAFKLLHSGDKLSKKSIQTSAIRKMDKIFLSENQLSLEVRNFTSDNKMALRDFLKLIKSKQYPSIEVHLNYIETQPDIQPEQMYTKVNASVDITITGVTRQYHIPVAATRKGDVVNVQGTKKISIRDFELEPPVQMMGLLRVSEWIDIDFSMNCRLVIEKNRMEGNVQNPQKQSVKKNAR